MAGPTISAQLDPEVLLTIGDWQKALRVVRAEIAQTERDALKAEKAGLQLDQKSAERVRRLEGVERRALAASEAEKKAVADMKIRADEVRQGQDLRKWDNQNLAGGLKSFGGTAPTGAAASIMDANVEDALGRLYRSGRGGLKNIGDFIEGYKKGGLELASRYALASRTYTKNQEAGLGGMKAAPTPATYGGAGSGVADDLSTLAGRNSFLKRFRVGRRDLNDVVDIFQGLGRGGWKGAAGALRGLKGFAPNAGVAAVGIGLVAAGASAISEGLDDLNKQLDAPQKARNAMLALQKVTGVRATNRMASDIHQRYRKSEIEKLNWVDRSINQTPMDGVIKGVFDVLGLSTRDGEIDARANTAEEGAVTKASQLIANGYRLAGMGDLASAQTEMNAANVALTVNRTAALGSPAEIYLRQDRAKYAALQYTQLEGKRPMLRTGD